MLVSFMLIVIVGFYFLTTSKISEAREESDREIAKDIANMAYREIETALSMNDGYKREFTMPSKVNGVDYSITLIDNKEITVNYLGYEYIRFIPSSVTGTIAKSRNTIYKNNGVVFINP